MPLYEYRCNSCGNVFEVRQKFADEPLTTHEGCGGEVQRLLSASAFQFKGTGWYVTDYGRKNGNSASNGHSKDTKTSGGSESKSDSSSSKTESAAPKTETKPSK